MNKKFFIILLFSCATQMRATNHVSHSFLATDNLFIPQIDRYQDFWHNKEVPLGNQKKLSVSVFGGASNDSKGLNKYFGPFDKDSFIVKNNTGGSVDVFGNQDILGNNFNLETATATFHSVITFKPQWSVVGAEFNLFFQRCTKYWASVSIPVHYIKTNMNIDEKIETPDGGALAGASTLTFTNSTTAVGSMKDALKQSALLYGKIDGKKSKVRAAEVRVTVGKNWKRTTDFYVQPYVGASLPTGNKAESQYLFEPIVGNGGHFALFSGAHFGTKVRETDESIIFLSGQWNTEYRFSNTQVRSIDPGGKPWGRYLAMYATTADMTVTTATFGINLTTKKVSVSPHFTHNHEWQLHIIRNAFDINLGYRARIQSAETIALKEAWTNPAISDLEGTNSTSPSRGINSEQEVFTGAGGTTFSPIREHELNLDSAAVPGNTAHTFFASISKAWEKEERVFSCNAGTSYTFGSSNATLHHWMLWSSLGINF
ncbi:hypothetical protein K9K77_00760 [Candidatus Babeliales bacterium]|nr:hypothetical protein [Candidatus Babeliales bacterium]